MKGIERKKWFIYAGRDVLDWRPGVTFGWGPIADPESYFRWRKMFRVSLSWPPRFWSYR